MAENREIQKTIKRGKKEKVTHKVCTLLTALGWLKRGISNETTNSSLSTPPSLLPTRSLMSLRSRSFYTTRSRLRAVPVTSAKSLPSTKRVKARLL